MRTQARLADLYRRLGRIDEAKVIESELLQLLSVADDDHPMQRAIKQHHANDVSSSSSISREQSRSDD